MPADETFNDVKPGDRISAREHNRITNAIEELTGESPPYGQQQVNVGGVRGQAQNRGDLIMVRITGTVVPQSSSLYTDSLTYLEDVTGATGDEAFNAVKQVWDDDLNKWADDPDGECVDVVVVDDQAGWRPLIKDDILPVQWKKTISKYVPLESREAAIVMVTGGADLDGYYPGVVLGWDSDNQVWVTRTACYVIDLGS